MPATSRTRTKTLLDSPSASDMSKSPNVMRTPVAMARRDSSDSHRGRALEVSSDSPGPNTQWEKSEHDGLLTYHDGRKWWFHCQCCDYLNDRLYHTKMHYQRIHVQEGKAMTRKRKYPGSESGSLPAVTIVKPSARSPRVKKESGESSPSKSTPRPRNFKASPGGGGGDAKTPVRTPVAAKGNQLLASPKRTKLYAGASPAQSPSKSKGDTDALVFTFGTGRIERDGQGCDMLTGLSINAAYLKRPDSLKKFTPRRNSGKGSARGTPQKRRSTMVPLSPCPADRPQTPVTSAPEEMFSSNSFFFSPMPCDGALSPGKPASTSFKFEHGTCPASPPTTRPFRLPNQFESPRRLFQAINDNGKPPSVPSSPWHLHGKSRENSVDFAVPLWKTPTTLSEPRAPLFHRNGASPRLPDSRFRPMRTEEDAGFLTCLEDFAGIGDCAWFSEAQGADDMVPCA